MDFDPRGAGRSAIGVWCRAALIGVLVFAACEAAGHRLYVTSIALFCGALLPGLDLVRVTRASDRALARFVDGLMVEGVDRPTHRLGSDPLATAIDRALMRLAKTRADRQQRIDLLEALVDNISAAIVVLDQGGDVLMANRAARRLLGEIAGPIERNQTLGTEMGLAIRALPPGSRDIFHLAEGQAILASVATFSAGGADQLRLIALQSLAEDLGAVELKAWRDLVRVLAHEMMNSLTPICSLSESLASRLRASGLAATDGGPATSKLAEAAEIIARRSAGLLNFVERYRSMAELPPPVKETVPLEPFAQRLEGLMAEQFRSGGVRFFPSVEPMDLSVDADPLLLEQAIINLLKNALDATRCIGEPTISLTCGIEGDCVTMAVTDNGPGLTPEQAESVFVPFFTTKQAGSGIGLTLSRQIASAHGGRLEFRRAEPTGATFRVMLPRLTAQRTRLSGPCPEDRDYGDEACARDGIHGRSPRR